TKIGQKSFKGYKKLEQITIGANVTAIGQQAFYGDSRLTSITVKSKVLKNAYSKSLKGISSKAKINVPNSKVKEYKKIFKNRGQKSSVVIK
ncbi:leucine-rich repeat protein, partial [Robinsoniella peoriensis]|uniref:leucine-rich repeat protein n=2 Tax=Robinsoniella TaxID=588605 RepID=UPI0005C7DF9C